MNDKKFSAIRILVVAAAMFLTLTILGRGGYLQHLGADLGDFAGSADYDYSGGSDWGSSWGSDSDWDSGSDWNAGNDWNPINGWDGGFYHDATPGYGGSYSTSDGLGETFGSILMIWVVVIVVLIIMTRIRNNAVRPQSGYYGSEQPGPVWRAPADLRPISEYHSLDPGFDENQFSQKLSNWYVQMQQQWTARNIESLRPFFTDSLYGQLDRQLDSYRKNHRTNYVDKIAVQMVQILGWRQENGEDQIYAQLQTRITDYTLDDKTGDLISGSQTAEKFMTYVWTLTRTSGHKTEETPHMTSMTCPHCGAPVNINESAKCPYCGSILTVRQHDFVVVKMQAIRQKTM